MKRSELRKIGVDLKEEQHIKFVDQYVRGQKLEGNCWKFVATNLKKMSFYLTPQTRQLKHEFMPTKPAHGHELVLQPTKL